MSKLKKAILISAFCVVPILILGVSPSVRAATIAELQAQIQALLSQIQILQQQLPQQQGDNNGTTWCHNFNANIGVGQKTGNPEIDALVTALQKEGLLASSVSVNGYDETLASAVSAFQEKYTSEILTPYNLRHGTGYVGSATRAKLNAIYGCGKNVGNSCTDSDNGLDYYTKGTISGPGGGGGIYTATDFCSGNTINEGQCLNGITNITGYTCPNGCENGACKQAQGKTVDFQIISAVVTTSPGSSSSTATATFKFKMTPHGGTLSQLGVGTGGGGAQGTVTVTPYDSNGNIISASGTNIVISSAITSTPFGNIADGQQAEVTVTQALTKSNSIEAKTLRFKINNIWWNMVDGTNVVYTPTDWQTSYVTLTGTTAQPSITVTSPNGGEQWSAGQTKRITWSSSGLAVDAKVNIYIEIQDVSILGSGSTNYITTNNSTIPASQGYYDWTIIQNQLPQSNSLPHQYKIRVDVLASANQAAVSDRSDYSFQISPAVSCTDTDNGRDYFVKGSTSGVGGSSNDYCYMGGSNLYEFYCDGANFKYEVYNCANGCENGACKQSTQPSITVSANSLDFGTVAIGSSSQKTISVRNTGSTSASLDFKVWSGYSDFSVSIASATLAPNESKEITITFLPQQTGARSGSFAVYTGGTNFALWNTFLSGTGSSQEFTCTDTDGDNYYTKGSVDWYHFGQRINQTDYCTDLKTVVEFKCVPGTTTATSSIFTCPNGCFDGVCNQSTASRALQLLDPNGGNCWNAGESHIIRWTYSGDVGNIAIDLKKADGSLVGTIMNSISASAGQYSWLSGSALLGDYKVTIRSLDSNPVTDTSDLAFQFKAPGTCVLGTAGQTDLLASISIALEKIAQQIKDLLVR